MKPTQETIYEYGIKLLEDTAASSPKRSGAFYNKETAVNRAIIVAALSAYIEGGKSVLTPIRVLDGIGATGVTGLLLKRQFNDSQLEVTINDPNEQACSIIKKNAELNDLDVEITNRDTCALMHERAFNFIYLDCHTSASQYLDAAFRNIPKRGILILTTSDDAALYGRTPEIALRNYGGYIVKTAYFKELAIRLVLAGVARSAARFNKAVKVLCCVSNKASFTVVIEVLKGAVKANDCLQMVQSMLHCSFCEDWAFLPNNQYPIDAPTSLLRCDCRHKCPGKTASCIGPIWSGPIFCTAFLSSMNEKLHPESHKDQPISPLACQSTVSILGLLLEEANCHKRRIYSFNIKREAEKDDRERKRIRNDEWKPNELVESVANDHEESLQLSAKEADKEQQKHAAGSPPFYLSLHRRHSGRGGGRVPRADAAVTRLREAGFRASRTHFDPCAIRTDAHPSEMWRLLGMQ